MPRFAILEAPSILGLFPKGVERLADALLRAGLAERLGARRAGRVDPLPYDGTRDPETRLLNPRGLRDYATPISSSRKRSRTARRPRWTSRSRPDAAPRS